MTKPENEWIECIELDPIEDEWIDHIDLEDPWIDHIDFDDEDSATQIPPHEFKEPVEFVEGRRAIM